MVSYLWFTVVMCIYLARYKQLLFYATKLAPLPAEDHTTENKVEGCVSQVRTAVLHSFTLHMHMHG